MIRWQAKLDILVLEDVEWWNNVRWSRNSSQQSINVNIEHEIFAKMQGELTLKFHCNHKKSSCELVSLWEVKKSSSFFSTLMNCMKCCQFDWNIHGQCLGGSTNFTLAVRRFLLLAVSHRSQWVLEVSTWSPPHSTMRMLELMLSESEFLFFLRVKSNLIQSKSRISAFHLQVPINCSQVALKSTWF